MTGNKRNTANNWEDEEDIIPDMTDPYWIERFSKARLTRGRPRLETPKISTTIRFDADVLARFRAGGAGWQSRINAALRQWLDEHGAGA
jgi:uncharacterized protein (DUF4415 family)